MGVKDMGLAEFGRKELTLAEHEMPGLMAARREFGPSKPFRGLNINGSLHMTIQTGVLIHKGKELEEKFAKDGSLPDPNSTDNPEFKCILQLLKDSIQVDKTKYTRMAAQCKGVSEEPPTGVHRLREMAAKNELLFPAINVNDCVTKSKFNNVYGCRHSLPDGIMRATDVMIGGKRALVCGYG